MPLLLAGLLVLGGCGSGGSGGASSPGSSASPGSGSKSRISKDLYATPDTTLAEQVEDWRREGRDKEAAELHRIAEQPMAVWLNHRGQRAEVEQVTRAAQRAGRIPVLVVYNLPDRDCGLYSEGGAKNAAEYRSWLAEVAEGIGRRRAWVVLEPDAVAQSLDRECLDAAQAGRRRALLKEAVATLKQLPRTRVYVDAGNADWVTDPGQLVRPLRDSGIGRADGFALNVSNFVRTAESVRYGKRLAGKLGGAHFVVDTSRNGNGLWKGGADKQPWCNPPGRALGRAPTTSTGEKPVDAYLWVKTPGESDGTCRGAPRAGELWPKYALGLLRNSR
jgi:endoglucanase